MQHDLKIAPVHFEAIIEGRKPFEIRNTHDRSFTFGDTLRMREWNSQAYHPRPNDPEADAMAIEAAYTGREVTVKVGYNLNEGVVYKGKTACIMAIEREGANYEDLQWSLEKLLDAFERRRTGFGLPFEQEQAVVEKAKSMLPKVR